VLSAKSGVSFSTLPVNFNFDGLGQPISALGVAMATRTLQVTGASDAITVEAVTGYVHE
jgi:hypothetical protein